MAPPLYSDLGKQAKDLFGKGYNVNFIKIDSTTKPHEQAEFKLSGAQSIPNGKTNANIELKYKMPKYGMTLTEKWTSANVIATELAIVDQVKPGSKVTLVSDYSPVSKATTGKAKADFGQENVRLNADVGLFSKSPVVNAAAVFRYQNWLVGVESGYDAQKSALTKTNVAFGTQQPNYTLHAFVASPGEKFEINDQTQFGATVYHKVNDKVEVAAQTAWKQGQEKPNFGLATLYKVDNDWQIRAKVHENSEVSAATMHKLNSNLKLTLSATMDLKTFNEGNHKFGAGLEFEP